MTNTKYILVAEDDPFIRKLFEMNLTVDNWEVEFAVNGQKAIEALTKRTPDLLLLDLLMPVKTGFEVLDYLKEQNLRIPAYILSNLSQQIDQKKAKELGALDYFVKSDLDIDELIHTMQNAMETAA